MKGLFTIIVVLFSFNTAFAGFRNCHDANLTDEVLIEQVEAIAAELDGNNHGQKILNMSYNRARIVRRALNFFAPRVPRLRDATDEDVMELLQDIVTSLETKGHHKIVLKIAKKQLDKMLDKLENNREVPTEIAVLTIDKADPFSFGTVFVSLEVTSEFTITNEGNGPATVIDEIGMAAPFGFRNVADNAPYPGLNGTCGEVIAAGESCTIWISFGPVSVGSYIGQFALEYNDGVNNQFLTKNLQGAGN